MQVIFKSNTSRDSACLFSGASSFFGIMRSPEDKKVRHFIPDANALEQVVLVVGVYTVVTILQ